MNCTCRTWPDCPHWAGEEVTPTWVTDLGDGGAAKPDTPAGRKSRLAWLTAYLPRFERLQQIVRRRAR